MMKLRRGGLQSSEASFVLKLPTDKNAGKGWMAAVGGSTSPGWPTPYLHLILHKIRADPDGFFWKDNCCQSWRDKTEEMAASFSKNHRKWFKSQFHLFSWYKINTTIWFCLNYQSSSTLSYNYNLTQVWILLHTKWCVIQKEKKKQHKDRAERNRSQELSRTSEKSQELQLSSSSHSISVTLSAYRTI